MGSENNMVAVPVEPTEAMWKAGRFAFNTDGGPRDIWVAMLDAALSAQQGASSPASGEGVEPRVFQAIHEALQDERDGKPCGCIVERGCEAAGYVDPESAADAFKAEVMARVLAVATPLAAATQPAVPQEGEAAEIIREMVRLADMGFEESMRQPEENGNFAVYERAKRFIAALTGAGENGEQGA